MKKNILFFLILSCSGLRAQNMNMVLRSQYKFPDTVKLSNLWGFSQGGKEYALVGTTQGLTIFDVTQPDQIKKLKDIPGIVSKWREVKTWDYFAYVTTEGYVPGQKYGLQIINLSYLPDSVIYKYYDGDQAINHKLATSHSLFIDKGYAYLYGSTLINDTLYPNQGVIILNLKNYWSPSFSGAYDFSPDPVGYVHDGYVRNDTVWSCHIYGGFFAPIDVKDKAHPKELVRQKTHHFAAHNAWLSDNGKTLFVTDEVDSSYLQSYDVSDISNIKLLDQYKSSPHSSAVVHNTHILKDYAITSWYSEGVVIVDAHRPDNLVKVGSFDTSPDSGGGYKGCWGVYPYLPSGNILASDIDEGLFVLTPTYKRASYLEGNVKDSLTGKPVFEASVEIATSTAIKTTSILGAYKTGIGTAGKRNVTYSKNGYRTLVLKNVNFQSQAVITKDVALLPGSGTDTLNYTDPAAGLDQLNYSSAMNVFPNPTHTTLLLSLGTAGEFETVLIYDPTGKIVAAYKLSPVQTELSIDAKLNPGIYFLRAYGAGKNAEAKLVKW